MARDDRPFYLLRYYSPYQETGSQDELPLGCRAECWEEALLRKHMTGDADAQVSK